MARPTFITTLTGPFLKYRLDLLRKVSPSIKEHILIFTDKFSYKFYEEHHDFFEFVFMDEYREKDDFSMEYELFPKFESSEEFLEKFSSFYGRDTGVYYPWETHRFIFEYLMDNEILNFAIVDTDFIFQDNIDMISEYFDTIPVGTFAMPMMGEDIHDRSDVWNEVQKNYKEILLTYNGKLMSCDGFFRGFHFHNKEDMDLFYRIWCETIQIPIKQGAAHIHSLYNTDFIVPTLMQMFATHKDYNFYDMHHFTFMKKYGKNIGRHYTRVEDTIYVGPRPGWERYGFDYSDNSSIKNFIKNNKEALKNYYVPFDVEITDKHVLTRLR
jgi:hypothetical protein